MGGGRNLELAARSSEQGARQLGSWSRRCASPAVWLNECDIMLLRQASSWGAAKVLGAD